MRLITFEGGFGYLEGDDVVPMGTDLLSYLTTGTRARASRFRCRRCGSAPLYRTRARW